MTPTNRLHKLYATTDAPKTIDELVPFAAKTAGILLPFEDVLYSDPYAELTGISPAPSTPVTPSFAAPAVSMWLAAPGITGKSGSTPRPTLPCQIAGILLDIARGSRFMVEYYDWKLKPKLPDRLHLRQTPGRRADGLPSLDRHEPITTVETTPMRKQLLILALAGFSTLPMHANAWRGGGFHGGGFHAGAGGFTSWHHAGYGGGGFGGAYHAGYGGVTHVGYGGVTSRRLRRRLSRGLRWRRLLPPGLSCRRLLGLRGRLQRCARSPPLVWWTGRRCGHWLGRQ